jgi:hypothetical protein
LEWVRAPWIIFTVAPASSDLVAPPARATMFQTSAGMPAGSAISLNQL